jgi:hypothetical protein
VKFTERMIRSWSKINSLLPFPQQTYLHMMKISSLLHGSTFYFNSKTLLPTREHRISAFTKILQSAFLERFPRKFRNLSTDLRLSCLEAETGVSFHLTFEIRLFDNHLSQRKFNSTPQSERRPKAAAVRSFRLTDFYKFDPS